MIVAVGLDSFDTALAGCTTHLASLITGLVREEAELLDYPWLIRLNPAAPWKTRGNAAVAVIARVHSRGAAERLVHHVKTLVKAYTRALGGNGKQALVAATLEAEDIQGFTGSRPACLERLYRRAVHQLVDHSLAQRCLARLDTLWVHGGGNRGLIGALAALGADMSLDHTFELIAYREPGRWLLPRRIDPVSVIRFDMSTGPLTFSNYDYELDKPLIAPSTHDPVLYGVRGEEPGPLLRALETVEAGEEPSHWTLYRSNQATNAHLRPKPVRLIRPYDNPLVQLELVEKPRRIPGGHVIAVARDHTGAISVAAYRETGTLREALESLEPGDRFVAAGQVKPHRGRLTLNLELLAPQNPGVAPPRFQPCSGGGLRGLVQPPLASLHHLTAPLERCLYRGAGRRWPPSGRVLGGSITLPQGFTVG